MVLSLNARIAAAAGVLLLAAPIWLPLAPFMLVWWRRDMRRGRAAGLRVLAAHQARAIAAQAEATMPRAPEGGWRVVAENVDRYLAQVHSPRRWRTSALLTLLEFAPCLALTRRLSRLDVAPRRHFLDRHLTTTKGFRGIPSLTRQLVRMGYYADAGIAASLGFRTMRERRNAALASLHAAATARRAVG
ncbi:MAG: hypothetical protein JNL08_11815 [Planctomycetes bacterium]|nr:hypothetical protein [Planctomycetota bacterium]